VNPKSYNQIVQTYADRLLRYALKYLNNQIEIAEDIVQNCFEALWKKRADVPEEKAKSYLFQVAHNQIVDSYRKSGRMVYQAEVDDTGYKHEILEWKDLLDKALAQLNLMQRSMILLKDYEGYSYSEIAEITNSTVGQVKINLFRARKKLKLALQKKTKKEVV